MAEENMVGLVDYINSLIFICQCQTINDLFGKYSFDGLDKPILTVEEYFIEKWPQEAERIIAQAGTETVAAINGLVADFNAERQKMIVENDSKKLCAYFAQFDLLVRGKNARCDGVRICGKIA